MTASPQVLQVEILAGASLSNNGVPVLVPGVILGFWIPANWEAPFGVAAPVSFQVSVNGGPAQELLRDSNNYAIQPTVSSFNAEDKNYWGGITGIVVRSGTAAAPVPQAQNVLVNISYEPFV